MGTPQKALALFRKRRKCFLQFPPGAEIQDAGVFIDANSGELRDHWLLSKSPPGTIITRWLVVLHMGTFLGLRMKILIFFSGIITTEPEMVSIEELRLIMNIFRVKRMM